jgi:hypothetical protein
MARHFLPLEAGLVETLTLFAPHRVGLVEFLTPFSPRRGGLVETLFANGTLVYTPRGRDG